MPTLCIPRLFCCCVCVCGGHCQIDKHDSSNPRWNVRLTGFVLNSCEGIQTSSHDDQLYLPLCGWWRAPLWTWVLTWGKETWVAVSSPRRWANAFFRAPVWHLAASELGGWAHHAMAHALVQLSPDPRSRGGPAGARVTFIICGHRCLLSLLTWILTTSDQPGHMTLFVSQSIDIIIQSSSEQILKIFMFLCEHS